MFSSAGDKSSVVSAEPTSKALSNGLVADQTSVPIVQVTFSQSLVDRAQVQVDSIVQ